MGEEIATDTNEKTEMTKFGKFCHKRGINSNLIMLKITLFVMYGATSSLLPYLTIHMQSIGLRVEEIAIIYLALPFTTFLSPPITGFLVDKFGKYKPVVVMSLLLNALFHHSLLFIPQQEIPGEMPSAYVMRHPDGPIEVWWSPCPSRDCPEEREFEFAVDQCLNHCLLFEEKDPKVELAPRPTNTPIRGSLNMDEITGIGFHVKQEGHYNKNENQNNSNDVLTSSQNSTTTLPPDINGTIFIDEEIQNESWVASHNISSYFLLDMHKNLAESTQHLGIEREPDEDENKTVTSFRNRFGEQLLYRSGVNITALEEDDLRCGGVVKESNMSGYYNFMLKEFSKTDCMIQKCRFRYQGPEKCPPDYRESDDRVFWLYFLLRFLATTMLSAGVTIMDPIALTMIEKYGGDFGRERLFSSIGMAIFSPITGILIDYSSTGLGYTDYSAAFYTYDILLIISVVSVMLMPLGEKLPADNVFRDLFNLLKMPHVIIFIIFLFVLGNFWGFIESFLFLYLKELGAPNYLLGITITVGTVSSIPFLYGAEKITRIFGHVNLIIIAFFSHAARLVGYSFIENAWWCFPFEAMEALSCHLMWVAAATYCSILAPKNLLATLIGVLGMAHFSLGRGSGSFCGGILIGSVGTGEAFRYMGLLAVVGGITYGLLHLVWLRKFDIQLDDRDDDIIENGETDKLTEPSTKDQGTTMSQERLYLMIKYNQIGSLTSLPRGSRADIHDHLTHRRSSYNIESSKSPRVGSGSASKVDLLKSALEINHKASNNSVLSKIDKMSNQSLGRNRADSAPKLSLSNMKNISQPALEEVVLEGVESTFYPLNKMRKYPSGILTMPVVEYCATKISDDDRKKTIPEETEPLNTLQQKPSEENIKNTSSIDSLQNSTKDGT